MKQIIKFAFYNNIVAHFTNTHVMYMQMQINYTLYIILLHADFTAFLTTFVNNETKTLQDGEKKTCRRQIILTVNELYLTTRKCI